MWRIYLQSVPKDEGLTSEIEYMGRVLNRLLMWDYGAQPAVLEFKFKDLIRQPLPMFTRAFEHMGTVPQKAGYEACTRSVFLTASKASPEGANPEARMWHPSTVGACLGTGEITSPVVISHTSRRSTMLCSLN